MVQGTVAPRWRLAGPCPGCVSLDGGSTPQATVTSTWLGQQTWAQPGSPPLGLQPLRTLCPAETCP